MFMHDVHFLCFSLKFSRPTLNHPATNARCWGKGQTLSLAIDQHACPFLSKEKCAAFESRVISEELKSLEVHDVYFFLK